MNKKQREAKRKNAQNHQKKIKVANARWSTSRLNHKTLTSSDLINAEQVINSAVVETSNPPNNSPEDVFAKFFDGILRQGSGLPLTPELVDLMKTTHPRFCTNCASK